MSENFSSLKNAPAKTPAFTFFQSNVATLLNIPEEELRKRRAAFLTEDFHFQKKGTRWLYSAEGFKRLHETLSTPVLEAESASQPSPQKNAAPTPPDVQTPAEALPAPDSTIMQLKVWRAGPVITNRRLLEAYLPDTDPTERHNIVRVQVSDNANFIRGMAIPCRLVQAADPAIPGSAIYSCIKRAPRQRGRW
jgi:hypothetical protein